MLMLCIFRRQRVEREAEDLFQTLQNEIDKLRETIDELDLNPDLQVSWEKQLIIRMDLATMPIFSKIWWC